MLEVLFELWQIERIALVSRLRVFSGDREKTAVSLNVGRSWVFRKITEWEIEPAEYLGRDQMMSRTGPKPRPKSLNSRFAQQFQQ